tara:strand:- start:466 stop:732 length:267 start_codon:yes stop_codon:yes gene_type:complete
MAAAAGAAQAVMSWLGANAGAIGTAAASTAAAAGTSALMSPDLPKKDKPIAAPVPDSKERRIEAERRLARSYANQGAVASAFGKDSLG